LTTRPGELGREAAQKIAQETAALLNDERAYREHVLVTLARMDVKLDNLAERLERHEEDDDRKFTAVTQSIGGSISLKTVGMAVAVASAIAGSIVFVVWIVTQVAKP
jgi:hypothetical protein